MSMTYSEAIEELKIALDSKGTGYGCLDKYTLRMSIKSLKNQEKIKAIVTDKRKQYREGWEEIEQILRSDEE